MLAGLSLFWGVAFYTKGPETGLVIVALITAYPALLMAFNSSWVTVKRDLVETYSGPIPIFGGRRSLDSANIDKIYWTKVHGVAGRGGVIERYALIAAMRSGKPVTLLDAFEREEDASEAARVLIRRLGRNLTPS